MSERTGEDGSYTIETVDAGRYLIQFMNTEDATSFYQSAYYENGAAARGLDFGHGDG